MEFLDLDGAILGVACDGEEDESEEDGGGAKEGHWSLRGVAP